MTIKLEYSGSFQMFREISVSWTVKNIDEPEWPYLLFFTVHETEKKKLLTFSAVNFGHSGSWTVKNSDLKIPVCDFFSVSWTVKNK
jgi:hypothetical protein